MPDSHIGLEFSGRLTRSALDRGPKSPRPKPNPGSEKTLAAWPNLLSAPSYPIMTAAGCCLAAGQFTTR